MLTGIASVIHPSTDLATDTAFWQAALGIEPYFDQPFYVGFQIDGQEFGLDPDAAGEGLSYPVVYWHTTDIAATIVSLSAAGARINGQPRDVGQGVMLATLRDASGNLFGLLQRPTD
ncbi:glyoxalase [Leifsonia shinshuensis]|uniref:VOC family protein n=1 Tax=Leifsonia shinshuensis TaxID=150026 RepID=UPI001F514B36|nr:VOC family protein [Leifsonia shinshuensis]MCI0159423.1 glyoxalase [Leifsonia shinshuensis]